MTDADRTKAIVDAIDYAQRDGHLVKSGTGFVEQLGTRFCFCALACVYYRLNDGEIWQERIDNDGDSYPGLPSGMEIIEAVGEALDVDERWANLFMLGFDDLGACNDTHPACRLGERIGRLVVDAHYRGCLISQVEGTAALLREAVV